MKEQYLTSKNTLIDTDLTPPTELRASAVRDAGIEQMEIVFNVEIGTASW